MQKWSLFDIICLQTRNRSILKVVIIFKNCFVTEKIIAFNLKNEVLIFNQIVNYCDGSR